MSYVLITQHNENINSHMEPSPAVSPRTPRYISELEKSLKAQKHPPTRQTFGYAETPLPRPDDYLKKGGGISRPIKVVDHPPKPCELAGKLPSIPPPRLPQPPRPLFNYRVQNIRNVHRSKGKTQREGLLVINNKGDRKKLAGSGAIPEYSRRPDYGQMPAYMQRLNARRRRQREQFLAKEDWKDPCQLIEEDAKLAVLDGLKHAWSKMQNRYICLPILIDTAPKVMKKANIEKQLGQLERDIAFLENNPYIYVYDDLAGEKSCKKKTGGKVK